jgi:hypothetical protein
MLDVEVSSDMDGQFFLSSDEEPEIRKPRARKGKEARHIAKILREFDWEQCEAWAALIRTYSSGIRHKELCSIAWVLVNDFALPDISRDARRSFPVLIKWYQDNWADISSHLSKIQLLDSDCRAINGHRELKDMFCH